MQLLYISPPRHPKTGEWQLCKTYSPYITKEHTPSSPFCCPGFPLNAPGFSTHSCCPCGRRYFLVAPCRYFSPSTPFQPHPFIFLHSYLFEFFSFSIFISAARRKRGAQINKRNNEIHKKRIQNKKIRQKNRGCHKEIIEQWKGEKMDAGREGTRLVRCIP